MARLDVLAWKWLAEDKLAAAPLRMVPWAAAYRKHWEAITGTDCGSALL